MARNNFTKLSLKNCCNDERVWSWQCNYSVFFRNRKSKRILLVICVDDVFIIGNNDRGISHLKAFK